MDSRLINHNLVRLNCSRPPEKVWLDEGARRDALHLCKLAIEAVPQADASERQKKKALAISGALGAGRHGHRLRRLGTFVFASREPSAGGGDVQAVIGD